MDVGAADERKMSSLYQFIVITDNSKQYCQAWNGYSGPCFSQFSKEKWQDFSARTP